MYGESVPWISCSYQIEIYVNFTPEYTNWEIIMRKIIMLGLALALFMGCTAGFELNRNTWRADMTPDSLNAHILKDLKARPLYTFNEYETDIYLKWLYKTEPDFQERLRHLAEKNINQPYELYLLGEFPFELYDSQPLYVLDRSDCVVFTEHIYAMALSRDWSSFFKTLMHLRYKEGEIGVLNRNHYAIYDWMANNDWLVHDITDSLSVQTVIDTIKYNKQRFFRNRYHLHTDLRKDSLEWRYIPAEYLVQATESLKTGDLVYVVRGFESGRWIGHYGMIIVDDDGQVNLIHSTPPKVIKQPLMEYVSQSLARNERNKEYNARADIENPKIRHYNTLLKEKKFRFFQKPKPFMTPRPYFYGLKFLRPVEPDSSVIRWGD
jgi:hypothetical protein